MKKTSKIKRVLALCLIFLLSINSMAAIVSDNDGSAFVTKAEFEALKTSFNKQIDDYNSSIDGKIDGAIASYLAGLQLTKTHTLQIRTNLKDINWVKSFNTTYNGIQYMWAPEFQVGYGSTVAPYRNWLQIRYNVSQAGSIGEGIPYDDDWKPDDRAGYSATVDNRTSTNPYCLYITELEKKLGDAYASWDNATRTDMPTWHTAGVIYSTGVRGARFYVVHPRTGYEPVASATVTGDMMTFTATAKLMADRSDYASQPKGSAVNVSASFTLNLVDRWYKKTNRYDMSKYLLATTNSSTVTEIPFWDPTNGFDWEIKTKTRAYPAWNSVFMYETLYPPETSDINNPYEHPNIAMPYAKVKDDAAKDIIKKTYSQALRVQGYPNCYIYNGAPLFISSKKDSIISFNIKNCNSTGNNSFAIKIDKWTNLDSSTGADIKIDGVSKSGNSGNIAAGAIVNVEIIGDTDKTWWFKSIGEGKWEIIGDIIEIIET